MSSSPSLPRFAAASSAVEPGGRVLVARRFMVVLGLLAAMGLTTALGVSGCAATGPRMRLLSSNPTGAAWAFVLEDRGHSAQLLVDGRPRRDCARAGVTIRCELRGLFPGGHTLELRLAGGLLRRSAVVGTPWPRRPLFVRARDLATVIGAAQAGADGVIIPAGIEPSALDELVEAAHKGGTRALIEAAASPEAASALVERYALDGVLGGAVLAATTRRFPQTHSFLVDQASSASLASHLGGAALALSTLAPADATSAEHLLDTHGALGLGLALIAERGAIIDGAGFRLLALRRRHRALREGKATVLVDDGARRAVRLTAGGDALTLIGNASPEAWTPTVELPPVPIDLLGGPMSATGPTVPPGELAVILASPDPDRTRY